LKSRNGLRAIFASRTELLRHSAPFCVPPGPAAACARAPACVRVLILHTRLRALSLLSLACAGTPWLSGRGVRVVAGASSSSAAAAAPCCACGIAQHALTRRATPRRAASFSPARNRHCGRQLRHLPQPHHGPLHRVSGQPSAKRRRLHRGVGVRALAYRCVRQVQGRRSSLTFLLPRAESAITRSTSTASLAGSRPGSRVRLVRAPLRPRACASEGERADYELAAQLADNRDWEFQKYGR
jgi:hypothetical protein